MKAPLPIDEKERLAALESYTVLDTDSEQDFDDLVMVATEVFGTPIGLITLVDQERQWFKARVGLDATETHRDHAFCAHAILGDQTLIVSDATQDRRFADNPFVREDPNIRFYAGAPLLTSDGHGLGTLCVIDDKPRTSEQLRGARWRSSKRSRARSSVSSSYDGPAGGSPKPWGA